MRGYFCCQGDCGLRGRLTRIDGSIANSFFASVLPDHQDSYRFAG